MADYDAIIIGAGHNGLTCAAYLGKAGLRVKVLERRSVVGGAAVTEEFHPGFRNSVASYTVSLLNPKIIRDLDLARHGLRIVERHAQNFLPSPDGRYLLSAPGRTRAEIEKFSARDAARYDAFEKGLDACADVLRSLVLRAPPDPAARGPQLLAEMMTMRPVMRQIRSLDAPDRQMLHDLFTQSASQFLGNWFESGIVQALYGFDAIVGNYASLDAPGTAYVLLHHAFGEVNGKKRSWGHAIGGMGAITQAMARAAGEAGVEIETDAPVREIIVEGGAARGVVLPDGRSLRAPVVAANVTPTVLYTQLLPEGACDARFMQRIRNWRSGSGTFRMNVALAELPSFSALPGKTAGDHHTAGIVIAPDLDYMERAYQDARTHGWSREPVIEMLIPSTLDDTLAPPGEHVASLFCQHVAPELPDGQSWDDYREQVADVMIDTVERTAPGFRASILGRQILSPLDLERTFGLTGGDIFHGAMSLDQIFWARPMMGYANYRGAVSGLYHCGAGAHPGGGVTGAPGHNAARAILWDRSGPLKRLLSGWRRDAV